MKTQLYLLLIPFALTVVATGILIYLALENGRTILWVAASLNALTSLLFLFRIVLLLREKPSRPNDSRS